MSKEGDKAVYAESMVVNAFQKLFKKETNQTTSVSLPHGLVMAAWATVDDETNERVLTIEIRIKKD